jgi:two-component system sensor histidine kinase YesM
MEPEVLDRLGRNLQVGEDPETQGFGVFSVHHRIRLAFGEGWGLTFESEPGKGTRVRVRQPLDPEGGQP